MSVRILTGDCADLLRALPSSSVDSVVTDPPYGLAFMGNRWDYDVPAVEVWAECLRVLKPGGYLLAFAGSRTQHRMAVRIEDAGFEIRDMIAWVYGSGFPKSHNGPWGGTALKPALEPITMARKPLIGTVAANVAAHGTGGLNIDGCRVESDGRSLREARRNAESDESRNAYGKGLAGSRAVGDTTLGRWPANLIHDGSEDVVRLFPAEAGAAAPVHRRNADKFRGTYGAFRGNIDEAGSTSQGDRGSADRFFYCAKASRADRNDGCEGMEERMPHPPSGDGRAWDIAGSKSTERANYHPTVKPTDLMRYLCRLVTPPGGTVLDPFMGSGSTGRGAVLEGFGFIGIEREAEYVAIAEARIAAAAATKVEADRAERAQPDLFAEVGA